MVKESEYFTKKIGNGGLSEIKAFAGQGLFTTDTDDMDWKLAHKLLMPAFSPRAVKVKSTSKRGITIYSCTDILVEYRRINMKWVLSLNKLSKS